MKKIGLAFLLEINGDIGSGICHAYDLQQPGQGQKPTAQVDLTGKMYWLYYMIMAVVAVSALVTAVIFIKRVQKKNPGK